MRCQQKTACITLVLFYSYPALGESQSQKSQIWRVPVVSPEALSETSDTGYGSAFSPSPERDRFFESLLVNESENRRIANTALVANNKISSDGDIRRALRDAGVSVLGAETFSSGNGKLILRASPGQAPLLFVDSVPLSSGFTASNPESLIPALAIQQIAIFPFVSQSGMPRRGNSGSLDLRLRVGEPTQHNELNVSVAQPSETLLAQYYSPPCQAERFWGCLSSSWQVGAGSGIQRVKDDNNTPLISSDDTLQTLKHNSNARWGGHFKSYKVAPTGGQFETVGIFGFQERGLNGLPASSASPLNRSRGSYQLLSHSGFSFSPVTGNLWSYGLSGRADEASFTTALNTAEGGHRIDDRSEQMWMGRFGLSHPLEGPQSPRVFTSGSYEHNAFESRLRSALHKDTFSPIYQSETVSKGSLKNLDVGIGIEMSLLNNVLLRTETFLQWTQMSQESECGAFAPRVLCDSRQDVTSRVSPGGALEIQKTMSPSLILYGLLGRTVRLPRPLELMGRPDGIVPNRNLVPESSDFVEVGLQSPYIHSGTFYSRDLNLITLEQVSPYIAKFANRPKVRRIGFFSTGEARLGFVGVAMSYERVWVMNQGRFGEPLPVPFVPSSQTSGQISYNHSSALLGVDSPRASLNISRSGDYFLDRDATYQLFPPAQLGLTLSGGLRTRNALLKLELSIRNLMNKRVSTLRRLGGGQSEVGWSYLPALPLAGRSLLVSMNLKSL